MPELVVKWHPILAADEIAPGHWQLVAQYGEKYGDIEFVRYPG